MTAEEWETFVFMVQVTMVLLFTLGLGLGVVLGSRWRVHLIPHTSRTGKGRLLWLREYLRLRLHF